MYFLTNIESRRKSVVVFSLVVLSLPPFVAECSDAPTIVWTKALGGRVADWLRDIAHAGADEYIVTGASYEQDSPTGLDVYLARINSNGDLIWESFLDYSRSDEGTAVVPTEMGCMVVGATGGDSACGLDCVPPNFTQKPDIYLAHVSHDGDVVWEQAIGGEDIEIGRDIISVGAGEYLVTGQTRSLGAGLEDVIVIRVNESGTRLWQKTYGGPMKDIGYAISAMGSGKFIVVGKSASFNANSSLYMLCIDSGGEVVWERTYEDASHTISGRSVIATSDLHYAIGGTIGSSGLVAVVDPAGTLVWKRTLSVLSEINDIVEGDDETLLAIGVKVAGKAHDAYVARIDLSGTTSRDFEFGTENDREALFGINTVGDSGYILVGDGQEKGLVVRLGLNDRPFLRGDTDGDETVTISDGVAILLFLFLRAEGLSCLDAMDANDDGAINVSDAILIFTHLFRGVGTLPEPAHDLGIDPTPDGLVCPRRNG